ncbi:hypothetical protein CcCBS67573_g08482 [Chytriomyces confervae]|uniref:SAM domain-containing protein n=1 Tax=Chytriomyces confervae TaxID=246404 RepID=A0A507ELC3_9FUNG|nr:hypothetical protein CcCBS67573_g08482 [Chytriomyces confervae]
MATATASQDCAAILQAFTSLKPTSGDDCCTITGITCQDGRIVELNLGGTGLKGTLPDFSKLTELVNLRLQANSLTGTIPSTIGAMTKLTIIDIGLNGLTGEIPSSISQMSALQEMYIGFNKLSGEIPSSVSSMASHLRVINMSNNKLTGPLPTSYGALTLLTELELQNNMLTGTIPSEYGSFTRMADFQLSNNQLTGSIPADLLGLPSGSLLYFQQNNLSGPLSPAWTARRYFNGSVNCFDDQTGANRSSTCDTVVAPVTKVPTSSSVPSQTGSSGTSSPSNGSSSSNQSSSNGGLIGGAVGGVLAVLLLAGLAYWWFRRNNASQKDAPVQQPPMNLTPSQPYTPPTYPYAPSSTNLSSSNNGRDIEAGYHGARPDELVHVLAAKGGAATTATSSNGSIYSESSNAAALPQKTRYHHNTPSALLEVYSTNSAAAAATPPPQTDTSDSSADLKKRLKVSLLSPDASQWTNEEVRVWAATAIPGIGEVVASKVVEHGVDGAMLFKLTNEHLRDDLGLVRLQDRMAFLDALEKLKGVGSAAEPVLAGPPVYSP